jgi:hypothetical protein
MYETLSCCNFYYKYSVGWVTHAHACGIFSKQFAAEAVPCENEMKVLAIPTHIFSIGTTLDWILEMGAQGEICVCCCTSPSCTQPPPPKGRFFFFRQTVKSFSPILKRHTVPHRSTVGLKVSELFN